MKKENIIPEIMVIKEAFDEERKIIDYAPQK